jgi:hypothetical protein
MYVFMCVCVSICKYACMYICRVFLLVERKGKRTAKHFVNLTVESKNVKMLVFPPDQLPIYYGYLYDLLSFM